MQTVQSQPVSTQSGSRPPSHNSNSRERISSLVWESVPSIVTELFSGNNAPSCTQNEVRVRDSETQTNCQNSSSQRRQSLQRARSEGSSSRHASRSNNRRRNRRSRDVQAHQLPKKKAIAPVIFPAPNLDETVEDTTTCLYPSPPSYDQAVLDSPQDLSQPGNLIRSQSLPSVSSENLNEITSKSGKFKNSLSKLLKITTPKQTQNHTEQSSSSPRRKMFAFKMMSPFFFRSEPVYSRMESDTSTSVGQFDDTMSIRPRLGSSSDEDEEIIDIQQ